MGGVGYPAGVAIVDASMGGCVLGSERKLKRPEENMPPRLRRNLPSIKTSAVWGREVKDQRATTAPHAGTHASGRAGQHFELFDSILGRVKKVTTHNHSLHVQYVS